MAEERAVAANAAKSRPDLASILGLVVALGGIVGGLLLEGGKLKDIGQFTAAMIVMGGTMGAVMISTPMSVLKGAGRRLMGVLTDRTPPLDTILDEIIGYATKARKRGLVSLEQDADQVQDPYFRKALNLAVDGTDMQELRSMMELEIALDQHRAEAEAKVFENAGGYAPTVGIIGAVLGLIQVMKNLANIDEVGHGIAVSFVATVYGVGAANLLFLPSATKIKSRAQAETQRQELILEGICGIVEGLNPKLLRSKLEPFTHGHSPAKMVAETDRSEAATADVEA
ncbi:MAG: flagellar motor protein [Bryobacteraceae bacterium]